MGSACAEAIASSSENQVLFYDKKIIKFRKKPRIKKTKDLACLIAGSSIVILAIKPQDFSCFLKENRGLILEKKPLLISLLAGVGLKTIQKQLPGVRLIRAMPNLAAQVKRSFTFLAGGDLARKKDLRSASALFSLMGETAEIKELFMDKATALAGSGPGFIYYLMDSFYQEALGMGFDAKTARRIVIQTFYGSSKLALHSQKSFSQLLKAVASPGGTTQAGIKAFEKAKLSKKVSAGIDAAWQKAKKISSE